MATGLCIGNGKQAYLILRLTRSFVQFINLRSCLQVPVKKQCPYMEKCYRKNPIHFNEMSHPHCEYQLFIFNLVNKRSIVRKKQHVFHFSGKNCNKPTRRRNTDTRKT